MDERYMVTKLQEQLEPRYRKILIHQNLATLTEFKTELVRRLGFLPVLNEVDIILVSQNGQFQAIEVKCFDLHNGSFNRPFYDGIGQALSLLRYGFDQVALWHLFSDDIEQNSFDRYGAGTWWFIRNQLHLPLDFSYFKVNKHVDPPQFTVMQYNGPNTGVELIPINRSNFVITWRNSNPFLKAEETIGFRTALIEALNIKDIVSLNHWES